MAGFSKTFDGETKTPKKGSNEPKLNTSAKVLKIVNPRIPKNCI